MARSRRTRPQVDPRKAPSALLWLVLAMATIAAARMQRELRSGPHRAPAAAIRSVTLTPEDSTQTPPRARLEAKRARSRPWSTRSPR